MEHINYPYRKNKGGGHIHRGMIRVGESLSDTK